MAPTCRASPHFGRPLLEPAWPRTARLGAITLALLPNGLSAEEMAAQRARIVAAADRFLADEQKREGYPDPLSRAAGMSRGARPPRSSTARSIARAGERVHRRGALPRRGDRRDGLSSSAAMRSTELRHRHRRAPDDQPPPPLLDAQLDPRMPGPPPGVLSGGPNSSPGDPTGSALRGHCAPAACWMDDARAFSDQRGRDQLERAFGLGRRPGSPSGPRALREKVGTAFRKTQCGNKL